MSKVKSSRSRQLGARPLVESERDRHRQYQLSKGDMLVEKWNGTRLGSGLDEFYIKNPSKARMVAHAMEMQNRHMKALKEDGNMIKSAFRTTPENLLRIVRVGVAQSLRSEIFNEWSLETPDDAFFFVDTVYGTTARGATAGDLVYESTNPLYATEIDSASLGTGDGDTLVFGPVSFTPVPLIPSSVRIYVNNVPVGNDDGNGSITGATIASGTVNYTSGAVTVTFSAGNAPGNGYPVVVEAQWDSENSSNYSSWGSIELRLRKDRFNARIMPLTYSWSQLLELTLGSTGIGNVDEMLVKRVADEHAKRKDQRAYQLAMRTARKNTIEFFDADFATAGSDNKYNHNQTILTTLAKISGKIYDQNQRGSITKIVAGSAALAEMSLIKTFESSGETPKSGSWVAGKLGGIDVYGTPANADTIQSDEALLAYRNVDEDGDVALAFGVMTELSAALDYPELYRKGTLATVEDVKEINSKFLRILKFQNV